MTTKQQQKTMILALGKGLWVANVTEELSERWQVDQAYASLARGTCLRVAPKMRGDFTPYFIAYGVNYSGADVDAWAHRITDEEGLESAGWQPIWEAPGFRGPQAQWLFGRSAHRVATLDVEGLSA